MPLGMQTVREGEENLNRVDERVSNQRLRHSLVQGLFGAVIGGVLGSATQFDPLHFGSATLSCVLLGLVFAWGLFWISYAIAGE